MKDKSLRVKLVFVSLLEHDLNQRISHFRSFNSTRKVNIDESFGLFTFEPDIALPNTGTVFTRLLAALDCKPPLIVSRP